MAPRKTDPQPFPTRGTPSGYREIWDSDDRDVMDAQIAERERQIIAREVAAPHRRGKSIRPRESRPPPSPADHIAPEP